MIRFTLDGEKYEFDDDRLDVSEVRDLRKVTGFGFVEFWQNFAEVDPDCVAGLVWLTRRRNGETDLRFTEVNFDFMEFVGSMESDKVETDKETDDESDPPEVDAELPGILST